MKDQKILKVKLFHHVFPILIEQKYLWDLILNPPVIVFPKL